MWSGRFLRTVQGRLVAEFYLLVPTMEELDLDPLLIGEDGKRWFPPVYAWNWDDLRAEPDEVAAVRDEDEEWVVWGNALQKMCVADERHLELVVNATTGAYEFRIRKWDGTLVKTLFTGEKGVVHPIIGVNSEGSHAVLVAASRPADERSRDPGVYRIGVAYVQPGQFEWLVSFPAESRGRAVSVSNAEISGDGKRVVVGGGEGRDAWALVADVLERRILWRTSISGGWVCTPVFSPCGALVYVAVGDGRMCRLDARTRDMLSTWQIAVGDTTRWAVSPDGLLFASTYTGLGGRKNLRIWSAETGERLYEWDAGDVSIAGLAFSPDSTKLAVKGDFHFPRRGATIQIWGLDRQSGNP